MTDRVRLEGQRKFWATTAFQINRAGAKTRVAKAVYQQLYLASLAGALDFDDLEKAIGTMELYVTDAAGKEDLEGLRELVKRIEDMAKAYREDVDRHNQELYQKGEKS